MYARSWFSSWLRSFWVDQSPLRPAEMKRHTFFVTLSCGIILASEASNERFISIPALDLDGYHKCPRHQKPTAAFPS